MGNQHRNENAMNKWLEIVLSVGLAGCLVACGGGNKGAASADDAADGAEGGESGAKGGEGSAAASTVDSGAAVCIEQTVGQRYLVEDALEEAGLEPVDSCLSADVMIQERGESGAYELRYQKVGAGEWQTCESALDKQRIFLETCIQEMTGGGPVVAAE